MTDNYFDSEEYSKIDFRKSKIKKGEYDNCTFINCNFEGIHASNIQFVACEFVECNFSNTIVKDTAFKEVQFINCKMIGVKFNECDSFLLQFYFKECQLNFSSFYQLKVSNTQFVDCNLQEVDFTETVIMSSVFDNCDKFIFDVDKKFTDYASSVGIKVIDSLDDDTLAGKFDVIILSHVIEHLANPTEVLEQLKTFLKEDGLILIATTYAETSILRHKIISFLPEIHLAHKYYFTRYSLSRMMKSINLFTVMYEKDWLFFSPNQHQAINIRKSLYDTRISKFLVKLNIGIPLYVRKFVSKYIKR